ncbi:MAG TPA: SH3 domain-containing protein [Caulobacteraceae bacterium]|nr:SH3 domain-containing protein [Caulobacteraceae bacterium]
MRPKSKRAIAGAIGMLLLLGACEGRNGEGADCPSGAKQTTPSGYCIPRYVSLKRGEVFGRKGPGKDYATVFVYHAKGLPVQVIDETTDWRRICDPDGAALWVASPMIDGRRTVMATGATAVALRTAPQDTAAAATFLRPRAIAALGRCKGDWCEVEADGARGWLKSSEVWGLAPQAQCR